MTLDEIKMLNPALSQCKLRIDLPTQKGSVIDVIRMIIGKSSSEAQTYFSRLGTEVRTRCSRLRINEKGLETWVADAPTLIEIIWELPGKAAKAFRRQSAHSKASIGCLNTCRSNFHKQYYIMIYFYSTIIWLVNTVLPLFFFARLQLITRNVIGKQAPRIALMTDSVAHKNISSSVTYTR